MLLTFCPLAANFSVFSFCFRARNIKGLHSSGVSPQSLFAFYRSLLCVPHGPSKHYLPKNIKWERHTNHLLLRETNKFSYTECDNFRFEVTTRLLYLLMRAVSPSPRFWRCLGYWQNPFVVLSILQAWFLSFSPLTLLSFWNFFTSYHSGTLLALCKIF